jgi:hypothetical protein
MGQMKAHWMDLGEPDLQHAPPSVSLKVADQTLSKSEVAQAFMDDATRGADKLTRSKAWIGEYIYQRDTDWDEVFHMAVSRNEAVWDAWLTAHGNPNQLARHRQGVLPWDERNVIAKDFLFPGLRTCLEKRDTQLWTSTQWPQARSITKFIKSGARVELTAQEWSIFAEIQQMLRDDAVPDAFFPLPEPCLRQQPGLAEASYNLMEYSRISSTHRYNSRYPNALDHSHVPKSQWINLRTVIVMRRIGATYFGKNCPLWKKEE